MTTTLVFIIIAIVLLCATAFALGCEIMDMRNSKDKEDIFTKLARSEDEKEDLHLKFEMVRGLSKSNISMFSLSMLILGIIFAVNIWEYRNYAMESLKTGKFGCEEVVRTKTKGDQVKVDTTYNFYRIKPEKE